MSKLILFVFGLFFFSACQLFETKKDAKPAQDISQYNVQSDSLNNVNSNIVEATPEAATTTKKMSKAKTPKAKTTPKVADTTKTTATPPSVKTTKTTIPIASTTKIAEKTVIPIIPSSKNKVPTAAAVTKKPDVQVTAKGAGLTPQTSALPVSFNNQMLAAVNALRKSGVTCGTEKMPPVKALAWNPLLEKASIVHVEDMDTNNHFSHAGTDGSLPDDRIKAAGYNWERVGENIGNGYKDVPAAIKGWKESTNHCKQMMSAEVTEIGAAHKGKYWCLAFAKPLE